MVTKRYGSRYRRRYYKRRRVYRKRYGRIGRSYKRFKKFSKISKRTFRGSQIMPDQAFKKMRYVTVFESLITSNSSCEEIYVIRGNGPWDPDKSGIGGQPFGWDEMSAWYKRYVCTGSKISVNFFTEGNFNERLYGYFGLVPTKDGITLFTDPAPMYYPGAKYKYYSPWDVYPPQKSTANMKAKAYMTTKKIFGRPIKGENDFMAETAGTSTTSLPLQTYRWDWKLFRYGDLTPTLGTKKFRGIIEVKYYVLFFDRKQVSDS